jgi:hypothetical protein
METGGELDQARLDGYKSITGTRPDLNGLPYTLYLMERRSLVLNVYLNEVKSEDETVKYHLNKFLNEKQALL